jgi:hypothetical protein
VIAIEADLIQNSLSATEISVWFSTVGLIGITSNSQMVQTFKCFSNFTVERLFFS